MKLAIRTEDNMVRAYFSTLDDSERTEVASLHRRVAEECPGAFEAWKQMLSDALVHALREIGANVVGVQEIKPEEKN